MPQSKLELRTGSLPRKNDKARWITALRPYKVSQETLSTIFHVGFLEVKIQVGNARHFCSSSYTFGGL
jgi:hypothetical protein